MNKKEFAVDVPIGTEVQVLPRRDHWNCSFGAEVLGRRENPNGKPAVTIIIRDFRHSPDDSNIKSVAPNTAVRRTS